MIGIVLIVSTAMRRVGPDLRYTSSKKGTPSPFLNEGSSSCCVAWSVGKDYERVSWPKSGQVGEAERYSLRPSSSRTGTSPEETAHVNTDIPSNFDADLLFTQSFDLAGGGDAVDMEQFASTVNPSANSDASQQTSLLTDFSVASSFNMNYSERQGGLDNIMSRERILYLVAMFFEFASLAVLRRLTTGMAATTDPP